MPMWDEHGYRHSRRRKVNRSKKWYDRVKCKGYASWRWGKYPRHRDPGWHFGRRPAPTETGYGVAYEKNPDARMYD